MATCCTGSGGPGYKTPLDAYNNGSREVILYVVCINPDVDKEDYLATVDVDPKSNTYCKVIYRTYTGSSGNELHHMGWNVCSSCHGDESLKRDKLVLPALHSNRVFFIDVGENPRAPKVHKVVGGEEIYKLDCSFLHTAHCLASGEVMISCMGDTKGNGKGDFVLIDGKTYTPKGTWVKGKPAKFGYDFWYQPYHDVMVSSEWGAPKYFRKGFLPETITDPELYGTSLNIFKWSTHELMKTIDLGETGTAPLEVRFLHDPKSNIGYVGCAVYANVFMFTQDNNKEWYTEKVIDIPAIKVSDGEKEFELNGLMTDILISLDDRFLYFSNWLHGDVRQYDITDRKHPKLTGQVWLAGTIINNNLRIVDPSQTTLKNSTQPVMVKGKRLHGGPQMLQLSLDGKRLYVSSSLYSPWDKQFYPKMVENGSWIVKLDIDTKNGGMKLDENFLVDFSNEPDGAILAHEMRYPGGDCTSDIWLADM